MTPVDGAVRVLEAEDEGSGSFAKARSMASSDLGVIDIGRGIGHAFGMGYERRVKIFRNGRNQAVRIPREFELPGEDAIMRKEQGRLVIEASPRLSLTDILATLEPLDEDFPEIDDPPPEPID